jgi:hypothetical protein
MRARVHVLLLAAMAMSTCAVAATSGIPRLNVEKTCRAEQNPPDGFKMAPTTTGNDAYADCMKGENAARKSAGNLWSKVSASNRQICASLSSLIYPSYVELMTCLQMYDPALRQGISGDQASPPARSRPVRNP